MKISQIYLNNFRNFDEISLDFKDNINVLVGKNAVGKTNILEAIYISLTANSFRTVKQDEFIKFEKDFTRGFVKVKENEFENKISFLYTRDKKKTFKIDDIKIKSLSELYEFSNVIGFFPDEIKILTESPVFRRNFFDSFIMKSVKDYKQTLNTYRNVIFRRNMLLRGINISSYYKEEMNALTKKAALLCYDIAINRKKCVDMMNEKIKPIHKKLANEDLFIEYKSVLSDFSNSKDICLKEILDKFYRSYKTDLENKTTNFGVHKENFNFILNENNAKLFSSQGQKRNIILSAKLSQKSIFEKNKSVKPIILLDDLFSELDKDRKCKILEYLSDNQVFITTTDLSFFENKDINILEI